MKAEEFYKDHFGHTSQHVSMDKIFVCMELYAIHKREQKVERTKENGFVGDLIKGDMEEVKLSPSEKMAQDIKWCEETLSKPKHTTRTGGLGETGPRN